MSYGNYTNRTPSCPHLNPYAYIKTEVKNLEIALYNKNKCLESKHQENHALITITSDLEQEIFFKQSELDKLKKKFNELSENKENYKIKYKKILGQFSLIKNKMEAIIEKITSVSNDIAEMGKITQIK